jgi:galactitol-specific phosphotransferase system IIC component
MPNLKKCKCDPKKLQEACGGAQREMVIELVEGFLLDLCGSELRDWCSHLSICISSFMQGE